jgi:hypothetical protein
MPRNERRSPQTALVCGKPVEYAIEQAGSSTGFLGIWVGNWNNTTRLCGALIIERITPSGDADVIYVYGSNRPGSGPSWKQQRRVGVLNGGVLSFQDDQGSTFKFYLGGPLGMPQELNATFVGQSGHLTSTFQKSNCGMVGHKSLLKGRHPPELKLQPVRQQQIPALIQMNPIWGDLSRQPPGSIE